MSSPPLPPPDPHSAHHLTTDLLTNYIDIPFNTSLLPILLLTTLLALHSRATLLLAVALATALILTSDSYASTSTRKETIKLICLLPLGLGSVLAFQLAPRRFQQRHLGAFTAYINVAVYGNIAIMVFTPAGDTLRGWCSKVTCAALFAWIVQQGFAVGWETVRLHGGDGDGTAAGAGSGAGRDGGKGSKNASGLFLFTAASKPWIFAHAVYRSILLTQPCFGSGGRHRLMEVYSLGLTWVLSASSGMPFEWCFGMADTLVVPVMTAWSAAATAFGLVPRDKGKGDVGEGEGVKGEGSMGGADWVARRGDVVLSCVLVGVAGFACYMMLSAPRGRRRVKGA